MAFVKSKAAKKTIYSSLCSLYILQNIRNGTGRYRALAKQCKQARGIGKIRPEIGKARFRLGGDLNGIAHKACAVHPQAVSHHNATDGCVFLTHKRELLHTRNEAENFL